MIIPFLIALHSADLSVKDVLDHVRAAVAIEAKPAWQEVRLAGNAKYRGIPCSYTMRYQPNGQFVQSMRGELVGGHGFDGTRYWHVDSTGFPRTIWYEDAYTTQASATVLTNHWLREGALDQAALLASSGADPVLLIKEWGNGISESVTIDSQTW